MQDFGPYFSNFRIYWLPNAILFGYLVSSAGWQGIDPTELPVQSQPVYN
jgi:hypothetical protein